MLAGPRLILCPIAPGTLLEVYRPLPVVPAKAGMSDSRQCRFRNPLNKAVLAWVVFDGAAKGVRTAVRGLLASTQPLEFRP